MAFENIECVKPVAAAATKVPADGVLVSARKLGARGKSGNMTRYLRVQIGAKLARSISLTAETHRLRLLFGTAEDAGKIMVSVDNEAGKFAAKREKTGSYSTTIEAAAELVGMSIGEARLHAKDDALNPPPAEAFELLPTSRPRALPAPQVQSKETDMARGSRGPRGPKPEEVQNKDFARAVKLYREDIKPAQSKVGEFAQEQSTAYKVIKKGCGIQPAAARAAFRLVDMEDAKREDWLRSFQGLVDALGIGIKPDLVDMAENEQQAADDGIPTGPAPRVGKPRPKLVTVPSSDGSETDLADAAMPPPMAVGAETTAALN